MKYCTHPKQSMPGNQRGVQSQAQSNGMLLKLSISDMNEYNQANSPYKLM